MGARDPAPATRGPIRRGIRTAGASGFEPERAASEGRSALFAGLRAGAFFVYGAGAVHAASFANAWLASHSSPFSRCRRAASRSALSKPFSSPRCCASSARTSSITA